MNDRLRTRRLAVAIVLVAILSIFPASAAPGVHVKDGAVEPTKVCPIDWRRSTRHVKKLIRCAAEHHGLSARRSLYVAYRESRFLPRAYNATSCAKGIFQHLCRYWASRAEAFGFPERSAFDARANIFVTMRMVRRYGWAPWGY